MTDRFSDINAEGGLGRNPISNVGRVVINGYVNFDEIQERKGRALTGDTLYGGPTDDDAFAILPRDICIEEKVPTTGRRNAHKMVAPFVLSTVNGGFKKTDKLWEVIENHDFRGLAGGQGAKTDSSGKNPEVDLALVQGGITTITNTGTKRIENGDMIYWTLPPLDNPFERSRRGSYRMPLHTMPFDPKHDELSEDTLQQILADTPTDESWPINESAKLVKQTVMQQTLNALHIILTSGLVKWDPNILRDKAKRTQNAREYLEPRSLDLRKKFLTDVSAALGLRDIQRTRDSSVEFRTSLMETRETTLEEFAMDVFFAKKDSALLLPMEEGTRNLPSGNWGSIIRNQKAVLSDYFASVNKANQFVERRIFAKAVTPAEPGKDLDVTLGKYAA